MLIGAVLSPSVADLALHPVGHTATAAEGLGRGQTIWRFADSAPSGYSSQLKEVEMYFTAQL